MKKIYLQLSRLINFSLFLLNCPPMKTLFSISFVIFLIPFFSIAQEQWKFHIAFEDGSGARDTIWLIWDSTATGGVDTSLGEGKVNFDYTKFNVWIYNQKSDSTKTKALPLIAKSLSCEIRALNFQYPIIVRWDTSLFNIPLNSQNGNIKQAFLSNDYFWSVNNNEAAQAFDMLLADSVFAPYYLWGSMDQFPMNCGISTNPSSVGIFFPLKERFKFYPNPSSGEFHFESSHVEYLKIISLKGDILFSVKKPNMIKKEFWPNLAPGVYFLVLKNFNKQTHYEKIIKY